MNIGDYKYVIAGSGFLGCVIAERIAAELKVPVLIIEKRNHIGGNCYSETDAETGIEIHRYGTHIFHTSNTEVWNYINRFTLFNSYRHQVLTTYQGKVYQMPVNLETINSFYNINLKPYEVDDFLQSEIAKNPTGEIISFEDKAISMMGRQLYEAFYKGYTMKQWQTDPAKLPASLLTRLPFRKNYEESYYYSKYQGIPINGYTAIFNQLLANPLITVKLNTDFFEIKPFIDPGATVIYSGPIDKYFDYSLGKLEWRSLRFELEVKNVADYQGTAVMNYAEDTIPYTRIHEFKHLHPERKIEQDKTVIYREFSYKTGAVDEPFYPVPGEKGKELVLKYRVLADENPKLIIAGRLGDYRYYDMHETIATALQLFENKITPTH